MEEPEHQREPVLWRLVQPSLGLWNGVFHFVFMTDNSYFADSSPFPDGSGFLYITGNLTDAPAKWTSHPVPLPPGYPDCYDTVSLALDSNHVPGIAFNVANDTYMGVAFWRPGMAAATLVAHNDGYTTQRQSRHLPDFFRDTGPNRHRRRVDLRLV